MTQITVDVVTTILLLLALNLLPRVSDEPASGTRWLHACVAGLAGIGIGSLSYAVMTRNFDTISGYYLAEAKPAGGGGNVVNVILVDFRGFDTFGEIIVLGIAAVAIFALLDTALRGAAARRLAAMRHPEQARDSHPLLPVSRLGSCCRSRLRSRSTSFCAATTRRAAVLSPGSLSRSR